MIIDSSVIEGLHNNTMTIVRCEVCGEIHTTRFTTSCFIDDENDMQWTTSYKDACPVCGHHREYGVAMDPPSVEL